MQIGELVILNTCLLDHLNDLGIGKVVSVRVWQESGNYGCDVTALWSDGTVQTFAEEELTYAVDNHENW